MQPAIERLITSASHILLGKDDVIKLSVTCLLARGHLLIEDLPGVGKTTLAHTLAKLFGLNYQRIQFTSDLLPSDIIGVSIYEREKGEFRFHPGPIFSQVVLADEVNRATPKAQSALLEAMEEEQVTVEGDPLELPQPFFVIATQNPSHQIGTFPLPESQLDRFLMRISIGYPGRLAERNLLTGEDRRQLVREITPVITPEALKSLQKEAEKIHVAEPLVNYCQDLLEFSRHSQRIHQGLSPRAGLAILRAARAWAFIEGRNAVIPEDVQAVVPSIVGHRLQSTGEVSSSEGIGLADHLLESVAIP
jgi:MoxR-like ATPase